MLVLRVREPLLDRPHDRLPHLRGAGGDFDAGGFEGGQLFRAEDVYSTPRACKEGQGLRPTRCPDESTQ
jgi:hypothetical protein